MAAGVVEPPRRAARGNQPPNQPSPCGVTYGRTSDSQRLTSVASLAATRSEPEPQSIVGVPRSLITVSPPDPPISAEARTLSLTSGDHQ